MHKFFVQNSVSAARAAQNSSFKPLDNLLTRTFVQLQRAKALI